MPEFVPSEQNSSVTAFKIGEALAYLSREAEAVGLQALASEICSAEEIAYETARQSSYLNV